jgi:phage terminase large subunit
MKSDATAIWIAQFVGREIRVLDYYEAQGQPLAAHVQWLRDRKYDKAVCVLPHDGAPVNPVADASWQSALQDAGFDVEVIPNQGAGAAKMRIEAARRVFPSVWFNADTTEPGRDALGWYHEKRSDDDRDVGLGPCHDFSSHGADAFGLLCICYEAPEIQQPRRRYGRSSYSSGSAWSA